MSEILNQLKTQYASIEQREFRGSHVIVVPADAVLDILGQLKAAGFDLLVDVTCVDYLQYRATEHQPQGRFGVTYLISNTTTAERLTIRAYLDDADQPTIASVVPLWEGANWLEREVWDLFGIHFQGHPDLRRIMLPDEFTAHPLRKDYPLQGRGERHNFPTISRGQA